MIIFTCDSAKLPALAAICRARSRNAGTRREPRSEPERSNSEQRGPPSAAAGTRGPELLLELAAATGGAFGLGGFVVASSSLGPCEAASP